MKHILKNYYDLGVRLARKLGIYYRRRKTYLLYILKILIIKSRKDRCTVLDLGCGDGYFSGLISKFCSEVIAVDIISSQSWNTKSSGNLEYILADARNLPLQPNSFNFVLAFSLLEHVENWPLIIKETAKILRDKGLFIIQIPNLMYIIEPHTKFPILGLMPKILKEVITTYVGYGDLQFSCTVNRVVNELKENGFKVIGIFAHHHLKSLKFFPFAPSYIILAFKDSKWFVRS